MGSAGDGMCVGCVDSAGVNGAVGNGWVMNGALVVGGCIALLGGGMRDGCGKEAVEWYRVMVGGRWWMGCDVSQRCVSGRVLRTADGSGEVWEGHW